MNIRIQIILGVIIIISLAFIVNMIKNKKMELKYGLSWICTGIILLILVLFPNSMTAISHLIGIELPANMLFFFGFCFSLMIIFILTIALSRTANKLKRVAQKVALMEKEIQLLKNTGNENKKC